MPTIRPRPIAQLTAQMGFVLLIGKSTNPAMPTRAITGRKTEIGDLITIDGQPFASGAFEAKAFVEIPYAQDDALPLLAPSASTEVIDLYISLRGMASTLPDVIGHDRTIIAMNKLIGDGAMIEDNGNPYMTALLEVDAIVAKARRGDTLAFVATREIIRVFKTADERTGYSDADALRDHAIVPSHNAHVIIANFLKVSAAHGPMSAGRVLEVLREYAASIEMDRVTGDVGPRQIVHRLRKLTRETSAHAASVVSAVNRLAGGDGRSHLRAV
jgi:hypothetical protein